MSGIRKNACTDAIIKTLSYSGVFGYPLTFYQLTSTLITKQRFTPKKIRKELNRLVEYGVVRKIKGKYMLRGVRYHNTEKRIKISKGIIEKNKATVMLLTKIPWIKMIAITGSVANQDAAEGSDLDLLFITEKNRLWICRGFVFLILKIAGKLPKNQKERDICPNIFIDERKLSWAKKKRNLYVAQNIISMQPLIWRDDIYFDFIKSNKWISKYFTNFKIKSPTKKQKKRKSKENPFMNAIENIARKAQINYMKEAITTEVVDSKLIHFNKNDSSNNILIKYKALLKKTKRY